MEHVQSDLVYQSTQFSATIYTKRSDCIEHMHVHFQFFV